MGQSSRKLDCCGAGFEREDISLLGVMTISLPFIILFPVLNLITLLLSPVSKTSGSARRTLQILLRANIKLTQKLELAPKLKCRLTGGALARSPRLAGLLFRYFNLSILLAALLVPVVSAICVRALWHS